MPGGQNHAIGSRYTDCWRSAYNHIADGIMDLVNAGIDPIRDLTRQQGLVEQNQHAVLPFQSVDGFHFYGLLCG